MTTSLSRTPAVAGSLWPATCASDPTRRPSWTPPRLGRSGLEVSRICFGTMSFGKTTDERPWVLGLDEARACSAPPGRAASRSTTRPTSTPRAPRRRSPARRCGRSHPARGRARHQGLRRMRPGPNGQGLSRAAILHEIDQSLRRLGTDYVDLTRSIATTPTPLRGDHAGAA
jgi:hypothetical protein